MNDLQPFGHQQSFNREIENTLYLLVPQYTQIENAEQTKKAGLDIDSSSMTGIIESTQETSEGDMAEPLQGQSPVHPHKMCPFEALEAQEDYFNSCLEKDVELKNFFWCGAANEKNVNNIHHEMQKVIEEIPEFPQNPASLDQFCNSIKLALSPLKRIKTDTSSGNSMIQPSTGGDLESEDDDEFFDFQNEREYERDPKSIQRNAFSVEVRAKFTQAYQLLEEIQFVKESEISQNRQSQKEFELLEERLAKEEDFYFPADLNIADARQKKMMAEIRKAIIDAGLHGVLELLNHPKRGAEFREFLQNKNWFQGVIARKEWFKSVFQGKSWYKKAVDEKKLLECDHSHNESFADESCRENCIAMRNLYALLYGMFKHGIDANGQERFEPDGQGKLYEVIGNKRFSPADDAKQMGKEEFCKKAGSSTLAALFEKESEFFETYVKYLYKSGKNIKTNGDTLTDAEKRQMLIAGKSYLRKKFLKLKK